MNFISHPVTEAQDAQSDSFSSFHNSGFPLAWPLPPSEQEAENKAVNTTVQRKNKDAFESKRYIYTEIGLYLILEAFAAKISISAIIMHWVPVFSFLLYLQTRIPCIPAGMPDSSSMQHKPEDDSQA